MRWPVVGLAAAAVLVAAAAAAWRWTPLAQWLDFDTLTAAAASIRELPFAPLVVVAAYVAAGLVVMPVTLLVAATGAVFGPVLGGLYALAGAVVSAATLYGIGRALGRDTVARHAGRRVNRISERLARRGVAAVAVIRLLPVAPFTVVNVVAGASRIRARDFLLGTVLGMAPGIAATVAVVDGVAGGADPRLIAVAAGAVLLLAAATWLAHRHLRAAEGRRA